MGCNQCCNHDGIKSRGSKTSTKVYITKINKNRYSMRFPETKKFRRSNSEEKRKTNKMYDKEKELEQSQEENKNFESTNDATTHRNRIFENRFSKTKEKDIKEIDDWDIIEDRNTSIKIKSITVYFDYYIYALEITYIKRDHSKVTSIHCANKEYLQKKDLERQTLNLANDEFINSFKYTFTTNTNFIRSIRIGTTKGVKMVFEGQVELSQINK